MSTWAVIVVVGIAMFAVGYGIGRLDESMSRIQREARAISNRLGGRR